MRIPVYLKAVLYLLPVCCLVFFVVIVFVSSMPYSTITPGDEMKNGINSVLPEGWSFFTRSPRSEMADIYRIEGSELKKLTFANAEPQYFFGLSRESRKIGMELSLLANKILPADWGSMPAISISHLPKKCAKLSRDKDLYYLKKGKYLISVYEPVPWAWAKSKDGIHRKFKTAFIDVW